MTNDEILEIFKRSGALLEGHFKLSSGLHSGKYLQCALVLKNPPTAEELCKELAGKFKGTDIDVVVGPALGGVVLSYELARQVGVPSLFTERDSEGIMKLRRGFQIKKGAKVLLCEDILTTGKSINEARKVVEEAEGVVVGMCCLINRSDKVDFDVKFETLATIQIPTYNPDECPLCKKGIPVEKPGSRK
ncbi:MAG TPA: orotate phosphoribosyltransferase [Elusimicrobiales bacterium]|nr:orotate phosphoribosyltransferase [Elusimicrobiales bacterium]